MRPGDVLCFQAGQEPGAALSWGVGPERDTLCACGVAEGACPGRGQPGPSPNSSWPPGQGTHPERSSGRPSAPSQKCSACTAEWAPRRTNWGSGGGGAGAAMCLPADRGGREQPRAPCSSRWHGRPGVPQTAGPHHLEPLPCPLHPWGYPSCPALSAQLGGVRVPGLPSTPARATGRPVASSRLRTPHAATQGRAAAPTVCGQDVGPATFHRPGGLLSQSTDPASNPRSHD